MKKILLANDHGGTALALKIKEHLEKRGFEVKHIGVYDETSVDYPDMADKAVREFKKGGYECAVLLCGTGLGISIRANKHPGIICALPQNKFAAIMAKEHNAANFIAFGGRIDYSDNVMDMLDAYLDAAVDEDERHRRRREKLNSPCTE